MATNEKTFTLVVTIQANNTPQKWEFSAGINGLEQLAIWAIVAKLGQTEMNKILNSGK